MKSTILFLICLLALWCPVFTQTTDIAQPSNDALQYNAGSMGDINQTSIVTVENAHYVLRSEWNAISEKYDLA